MLRDFTEIFNPSFQEGLGDNVPPRKWFLRSLMPEQLQAMANQQKGLPVASLSPSQQQEIQQFIVYMFVQRPTRDLQPALDKIQAVVNSDPQFCWHDLPEIQVSHVFGFEIPSNVEGKTRFTILSNPGQLENVTGRWL